MQVSKKELGAPLRERLCCYFFFFSLSSSGRVYMTRGFRGSLSGIRSTTSCRLTLALRTALLSVAVCPNQIQRLSSLRVSYTRNHLPGPIFFAFFIHSTFPGLVVRFVLSENSIHALFILSSYKAPAFLRAAKAPFFLIVFIPFTETSIITVFLSSGI